MTQSDAWYEMFLAYSMPKKKRTKKQTDLVTGWSICEALGCIWFRDEIKSNIRENMENIIADSMSPGAGPFDYAYEGDACIRSGPDPANDVLRADFCYYQYLDSGGEG